MGETLKIVTVFHLVQSILNSASVLGCFSSVGKITLLKSREICIWTFAERTETRSHFSWLSALLFWLYKKLWRPHLVSALQSRWPSLSKQNRLKHHNESQPLIRHFSERHWLKRHDYQPVYFYVFYCLTGNISVATSP